MKLVLATRNRHKIAEMLSLIGDLEGLECISLDRFPEAPEVVEDGQTLRDNAVLKVRQAVFSTGLVCLAEDTGLEIDALGGRPGVWSARFAGEGARYEENVDKVLRLMEDVPPEERAARFRSVVAVQGPDDQPRIFEGICPGRIIGECRGCGGFGYDPIFVPAGHRQTFAQLEAEKKNRISHRAKALTFARNYLIELVSRTSQDRGVAQSG